VSFWTSGSSEGEFCDVERTFAWCSSGENLSEAQVNSSELWVNVPDGNPSAERCLSLDFGRSGVGLTRADCQKKQPFLCEARNYFFQFLHICSDYAICFTCSQSAVQVFVRNPASKW